MLTQLGTHLIFDIRQIAMIGSRSFENSSASESRLGNQEKTDTDVHQKRNLFQLLLSTPLYSHKAE